MELQRFSGGSLNDPWLSVPLPTIGPNIELVDVKLDGMIELKDHIEISVMNSGESLQNLSIQYTIIDGENASWALFTSKDCLRSRNNQTSCCHRARRRLGIIGYCRRRPENLGIERRYNTFSKTYSAPEEINLMLYLGAGKF